MRYHTKEYYTLMMAQGAADLYEPIIDKEYTDEDIEDLYQQAMDRYIEDEREDYDAPPVLILDDGDPDSGLLDLSIDAALAYENREPFDEEQSRADFEELYRDNLEEPDEDLPDWVREAVDKRILAMYFMPEKIYRKLAAEDEANEEKFDAMDDEADEKLEELLESLPEDYQDFIDILEDLEDLYVTDAEITDDEIRLTLSGWDDEGDEEEKLLVFSNPEIIENDGVEAKSWEDEDGDTESDCELLYSELYMEDGRPEVHMLFDNNGLKYLTFRCGEALAFCGLGTLEGHITIS